MDILIELNLYGRDYEQELRPLIRAFLPHSEFEVNHYEAEEEPMRELCHEEPTFLLAANPAYEYTFSCILMNDWYRIRVYRSGVCVGRADADAVDPERKAYRNSVAREIYRVLASETGTELPWGILTGVRPTKLVYEALEAGEDAAQIESWLREEYLVSEEKIATSLQVARREREILTGMNYRDGYSIYIGIPFCPTTCHYCSFTSYPLERFGKLTDAYLDALTKEIEYLGTCMPGRKLQTVYIGGGTPTALSAEQLERLLTAVWQFLPMENCIEFTVEAGRPDSITERKLRILKEQGVTRISINPQTMQQRTLDLIGRRHTVQQIIDAMHMARELGHDNINMDIIIGLTGENPDDVRGTLAEIAKLDPDSLTVHTLARKRAARLTTQREDYEGMEAQGVTEMLAESIRFCREHNYLPYYLYRQKNMAENLENVGYAKHGREGIYNILIMEEKQTILAAGAGAMSKFVFYDEDRIERVENVKSLTDYIDRIDEMIGRKQAFLAANELPGGNE